MTRIYIDSYVINYKLIIACMFVTTSCDGLPREKRKEKKNEREREREGIVRYY